MSTNYNSNTIYGIFVDADIVEMMKTDVPPVVETQERFNEFTGKSLGKKDIKVKDGFKALVISDPARGGFSEGDYFGEGSECGGTTVEGLSAIMSDNVNIHLQAWAVQSQLGEVYGYVIGMCLKDRASGAVIKIIKLVDKHAKQINKTLNVWLKGKNRKSTDKPMVHSILEVY